MAKKDFEISENIDRGGSSEKQNPPGEKKTPDEIPKTKTEVKNANAAGQGAIGRNDQEGSDRDD